MHFAYRMILLVNYPPKDVYSKATIQAMLEKSGCLIKYQKCLASEILETRFFLHNPMKAEFVEFDKELLEGGQVKWRESMRYLKFQCKIHRDPLYICRVVQRVQGQEGTMKRGFPVVKEIDRQNVHF